jgi:hypothetical protein
MNIASVGIDLGKTTFHLVALGERNKILLRRKFSRSQLLAYTANLPASLIGLDACAGSQFIGTVLREQGHQVRLIPEQFVKPYRKSNKNDFIDAEAIAEAVTKQNMRFVQIKTQDNSIGRPCTAYSTIWPGVSLVLPISRCGASQNSPPLPGSGSVCETAADSSEVFQQHHVVYVHSLGKP